MMQAMEENKNFDNWYRNRITENGTEPPADTWENISDELDTRDVWQRISTQLDTPRGWSAHKTLYYAVPLAVLLFLSAGLYYYNHRTADSVRVAIPALDGESNTTATPENRNEKPLREGHPEKAAAEHVPQPAQQAGPNDNGEATAYADIDALSGRRKEQAATAKKAGVTDETPVRDTRAEDETRAQETRAANQTQTDEPSLDNTGSTDQTPVEDTPSSNETPVEDTPSSDERREDTRSRDEPQDEYTHAPDETQRTKNDRPHQDLIDAGAPGTKGHSRQTPHRADDDAGVVIAPELHDAHGDRQAHAEIRRTAVVSLPMPDSMLTTDPLEAAILPVYREQVGAPLYRKSIAFGITASAKNTWLLNRTTLMGLEKHTLTTTLPDFGKDIGMVMTYDFSPRWSVQGEGMFVSEVGQRYQEYRNGKYVGREVDLRYYTMNLVMKYRRNTFVGPAPANGHALVGGIFAGKLHRATETISDDATSNDNATHNPDGYTQFNYGVLAGYEYNRYIFKNLVFTTGLRVNYGFPNIDALRYSRTVTGSFDVNVALKYRVGL